MLDSTAISDLCIKTLNQNKAQDLQQIDVTALTDVTDSLIVCTATSTRHAGALANKLLRVMREQGIRPLGTEGEQQGDWILVDLQDVIVHIMLAETRDFYALEKLWKMAEKTRRQDEA